MAGQGAASWTGVSLHRDWSPTPALDAAPSLGLVLLPLHHSVPPHAKPAGLGATVAVWVSWGKLWAGMGWGCPSATQ